MHKGKSRHRSTGHPGRPAEDYQKKIDSLKNAEALNYTLFEIASAVNTTRNLEELYVRIHKALNRLIPLPNFFIAIFNPEKGLIEFRYCVDQKCDYAPIVEDLNNPRSLTGRVIAAKKPLLFDQAFLEDRERKNEVIGATPKVWIGVPLIVNEKVIGAIAVQDYTHPDYFSKKEMTLLTAVSDQVAIAIERKQILDNLQESEEKFSLVFQTTPDAIAISRLDDGTLVDVNEAFVKGTKVSRDQLVGRSSFDIGIWESGRARDRFIRKLKKNGQVENYEMKLVFQGEPHELLVSSRILNLNDIPHIVTIARNMSEYKALEAQLQQRRKLESIGTLAAGIAHDFNNLLAGIIGSLDLLAMDLSGFSSDQQDNLKNAVTASQRAAGLIKQIQVFAQTRDTRKTSVDLHRVVTDVLGIINQTTSPLIEKICDIPPERFFVSGYENELHQVVMNLCVNGIQAIEEKTDIAGNHIRMSARRVRKTDPVCHTLPHSAFIHLCFEDTGTGMDDDTRLKAFDPMFTTKRMGDRKGQGLGLAIVYSIITRKHHGYIDIDSRVGEGTRFNLYLPAAEPGQAVEKETTEVSGGGPMETILVIEDEQMVRNVAVKALRLFGYSVVEARDGLAGIELFRKMHGRVDAVLLDLIMPKMSGIEVLKQMLEIDPHVRVIIASGQISAHDQPQLLAKAKAHVSKPYHIKELKQTVRNVLDGQGQVP